MHCCCVLAFLGGGGQNLLDQQASACLREEGEEQVRGLGGECAGAGTRQRAPFAPGVRGGEWLLASPGGPWDSPAPLPPPFHLRCVGHFGQEETFGLVRKEKRK